MRHALAILLAFSALPAFSGLPAFLLLPAQAAQAGLALVTVSDAHRGALPLVVMTYGTASPALDSGSAISLPQDGRVVAIHVTQGERVHPGTRLLTFDLSAASTSAYTQAASARSLALSERAHTAQLLGQRLATRDQLAQADKAVTDAQATLDALVRQGADRPRTEVTSPVEGVVDSVQAAQGIRLLAGAPLLTLSRVDNLVVTAGIDPALIGRVAEGQAVTLRRLRADLAGQPSTQGHVLRVDDVLNPKTRLVDVDIAVPAGSVILGEFFSAAFTLGALQGWIVPHDAVLDDEHGFHLFQLHGPAGHAVAARVDVRVLGTSGDYDVVEGTLQDGQPVVRAGATQLADGDAVRTAP